MRGTKATPTFYLSVFCFWLVSLGVGFDVFLRLANLREGLATAVIDGANGESIVACERCDCTR